MRPAVIWTIGHSTRSLEEFVALLRGEEIELVADVRRYPASRMHPHFNAEALGRSLIAADLRYEGYPDYMETPAFDAALARLMADAAGARTAIMCAEAPWWRCHRALIADALKARGIEVLHIMGKEGLIVHPYTSAASVMDGKLYYGPLSDLFG